jgi:hypothetical protein
MFRAIIRPSSGAHDCGFLTAYGIVSCKDGNVAFIITCHNSLITVIASIGVELLNHCV